MDNKKVDFDKVGWGTPPETDEDVKERYSDAYLSSVGLALAIEHWRTVLNRLPLEYDGDIIIGDLIREAYKDVGNDVKHGDLKDKAEFYGDDTMDYLCSINNHLGGVYCNKCPLANIRALPVGDHVCISMSPYGDLIDKLHDRDMISLRKSILAYIKFLKKAHRDALKIVEPNQSLRQRMATGMKELLASIKTLLLGKDV